MNERQAKDLLHEIFNRASAGIGEMMGPGDGKAWSEWDPERKAKWQAMQESGAWRALRDVQMLAYAVGQKRRCPHCGEDDYYPGADGYGFAATICPKCGKLSSVR